MTKKLMLTAMAVMSVAIVKPNAVAKEFAKDFVGVMTERNITNGFKQSLGYGVESAKFVGKGAELSTVLKSAPIRKLSKWDKRAMAFLDNVESAKNAVKNYPARALAAGSGMLGSGWLADAIYTDMNKPAVTKMDKVKNALSSAKNYVVDSRLGTLVANNPKTAIAAVSATALAGIGAYVAKNFEFGSEVEAKTAPKAEAKTAPVKQLTPAQKFKLRSQGIKC